MNNHASIPVGVLGASGYVGQELLRLLDGHPGATVAFATAESAAGGGALGWAAGWPQAASSATVAPADPSARSRRRLMRFPRFVVSMTPPR